MPEKKTVTLKNTSRHAPRCLGTAIGNCSRREIALDKTHTQYFKYSNPILAKCIAPNPNDRRKTRRLDRFQWYQANKTMVLLNDVRPDAASTEELNIITTAVLIDEILNTNRGAKVYQDWDKNVWYVTDDVYNAEQLNTQDALPVLDAIWFMREQNINALKVVGRHVDDAMPRGNGNFKILSNRYKTLAADYITAARNKARDTFAVGIAECVKWWSDNQKFKMHFWQVEGELGTHLHLAGLIPDNWHNGCDLLRVFASLEKTINDERRCAKFNFDEYVKIKFDAFLNSKGYLESVLADHYGFSNIAVYSTMLQAFGISSSCTVYHVIAEGKYKRGQNLLYLDFKNVINAEVLKLRRFDLEGTFDE